MPDINTLARYAAANSSTDTELLSRCMEAAQTWLQNAGVARRTDDQLYDLAVYMLATHYFDNRGVAAEGSTAEIPMGVMSIMHQLRLDTSAATCASGTDGGADNRGGDGA